MGLGQLDNCPRCDALFVRTTRDVCPNCYREIEAEYEKCVKYLRKRENRSANIHQVSEATGVSVKQITRFIKEGRISLEGNPNLGYPCERCGIIIRTGNMCDSCMKELRREVEQQLEVDERLAHDKTQQNIAYQSKKER
ncbi:TIGR03826 family flagellar region protein [Brevibacillus fulvus]|uniref:Flagellar operon protein (TIGR03826 family) n=1 Tax=Brevibacillus fulvus TaxID=1125967 RepID=A0A939BQD8_9BACL|nr:TIGR03826 family flagellar region protein [Brevibacillus fulvus]MBM7591510.1 flagellar operon protein (TIGR03826 family) [Brevibacillus fulvus]